MPHASDLDTAPAALSVDQLLKAPTWIPDAEMRQCETYRQACVLAWDKRQMRGMTKALLAAMAGLHAPHVTNFFHHEATDRHGARRAELPASAIPEVEKILGNRAISQFLARKGAYQIAGNHVSRGDYGVREGVKDCEPCGA